MPCGTPSQAYGTLRYCSREQKTEDREQKASTQGPHQSLQHLRDLLIFVSPDLPRRLIDIAEIQAIAAPQPHLVRRSQRHRQVTTKVRRRVALPRKAFRDIRTDRLRSAPHLITQSSLLIRRKPQAHAMHLKRQPIRTLERPRGPQTTAPVALLSVLCPLTSVLWNPHLRYVALAPIHFRRRTACLDQ